MQAAPRDSLVVCVTRPARREHTLMNLLLSWSYNRNCSYRLFKVASSESWAAKPGGLAGVLGLIWPRPLRNDAGIILAD